MRRKVRPAQPPLQPDQKVAPLARQLIGLRVVRLVDFMNRTASRAFPRVSGLSDFQWRVLAWVCETPRLSVNELSARLQRGVAQVSRTVKRLVAAGLLHR